MSTTEVELRYRNPFRFGLFGPAIVLLAFGQATGELMHWPYLAQKYGSYFAFLLLPACAIQLPMFDYLARHSVVFGEPHFSTLLKSSKAYGVLTWVVFLLTTAWISSYTASAGIAIAKLINASFGANYDLNIAGRWGALVLNGVFFLMLLLARSAYRLISRVMTFVAATSLLAVGATFLWALVTQPLRLEFFAALVSPKLSLPGAWDPADSKLVVTAIVFAGLGGLWNVLYSVWVCNERLGAAEGGPSEFLEYRSAYPNLLESVESKVAYGRTMRLLRRDLVIGLGVNAVMIGMLMYVALACFPSNAVPPRGIGIITSLGDAVAYRSGLVAAIFYVMVGLFLGDTWLTAADALSKVNTTVTLGLVARRDDASMPALARRVYLIFLLVMGILTVVTAYWGQPQRWIYLNGVLSAFGSVVLILGLMINERALVSRFPWLPKSRVAWVSLVLSLILYTVLAVFYILS